VGSGGEGGGGEAGGDKADSKAGQSRDHDELRQQTTLEREQRTKRKATDLDRPKQKGKDLQLQQQK
jgi:hypothetical protein